MRTSCLAVLLIAAGLTFSGCIDSTTTVEVGPDGAGTVTEAVYVNRAMESMLTVMTRMSAALLPRQADAPAVSANSQEKYAKRAAAMGRGVTLVSVNTEKRGDGKNGTRAVYAFADINKVRVYVDPPYPVPEFSPATNAPSQVPTVMFEFTARDVRELRVLIPWSEGSHRNVAARQTAQRQGAPVSAEDIAILRHTLDGFRARFFVTTTPPPKSLTAGFSDTIPGKPAHRRALLFDLNLGELVRNEGYLDQLGALGPATDMTDAVARYAGLPMLKVERQPVVQIRF